MITGGADFLGSHLCDKLINACETVVCVDNSYTELERNNTHLIAQKTFEFMRYDACFPLYLELDRTYNFACTASPSFINMILCRQPRPEFSVKLICLGWQDKLMQGFYRPQPLRNMVIMRFILNRKVSWGESKSNRDTFLL